MTNKTYTTPFITFEGGEGAGKTTQIKLLADWLRSTGKAVTTTREPGTTPGAEDIRNLIVQGKTNRWDAETDTLLFMASRRDNLTKVIWPALESGDWVISDRFVDSSIAYQCYGRGLAVESMLKVYEFVGGDFYPDLTFILDLEPHIGLERAAAIKPDRNLKENRFESFGTSFHERIRAGYHAMAKESPQRFVMVDANRSIEDIQRDLQAEVTRRFLTP